MTLPLFFAVLIFAPALFAVVLGVLGVAGYGSGAVSRVLASIGALVPAVGLIVLAPDASAAVPLRTQLWGDASAATGWLTPALRVDSFALYAAFGLAFLVAPLLLWIASRRPTAAEPEASAAGTPARDAQWASLALVLALESAAIWICFSDSLVWTGIMWLALVALTWGLGELGTAVKNYDRVGLAFAVAGPALWLIVMVLTFSHGGYTRFFDMMNSDVANPSEVVGIAVALALAGGGYPFTAWLRRRAWFSSPAGLAALLVAAIPAAIFIGGRTYSALENGASALPTIGGGTPPITIGIAFGILGGITVVVCGLVALGQRESRSLVALLAAAQVGWALLAMGASLSAGMLALVLLLATSVLGLGAMVAALVSGGVIHSDDELPAAGPRVTGGPFRALDLFAWLGGAAALLGAPLVAGFLARDTISGASLTSSRLAIPLQAIAWVGDLLLALAILRATAPAFYTPAPEYVEDDDELEDDAAAAEALEGTLTPAVLGFTATPATASADFDLEDEDDVVLVDSYEDDDLDPTGDESDDADGEPVLRREMVGALPFGLSEVPGAIFAALALGIGIVPQLLLSGTAFSAAGDLIQASPGPDVSATRLGFSVAAGSWSVSGAWLALIPLALVFLLVRAGGQRVWSPIQRAGQAEDAPEGLAMAGFAAPEDAWDEMRPAFESVWLSPGVRLLIPQIDNAEIAAEAEEAEEAVEVTESAATVQQPAPVTPAAPLGKPADKAKGGPR